MKAIILARVSSKEQEDNESIPAQTRRLNEYCEKNNLTIFHTFQIVESSTKENRKKFQNIIHIIKISHEKIALVTDTIDRLQRGFKESVMLDEIRKAGKLQLHFVRENLIIDENSNSADILRWDMGVMFAKSYVTQLTDNIKRSQEEKLRNGEWLSKAPFGYKNTLLEGKKWIVPDDNAVIVRDIFQSYASQNFSMRELRKYVREQYQLNLNTSRIQHILSNPFYSGEMRIKGKFYKHVYQSIISRELFEAVQQIRDERFQQEIPKFKYTYGNIPYAYRGLIVCGECGCRITPERSKGHFYYHCTQSKGKHNAEWLREEDITNQIANIIATIQPSKEQFKNILESLKASHAQQDRMKREISAKLNGDLSRYSSQLTRVFDAYLDGLITKNEFAERKAEIEKKQNLARTKLESLNQATNEWYENILLIIDLFKQAPLLFEKSSEPNEKRQIVNLIFRNLTLDGRQLRYELKKPFNEMVNLSQNKKWCWL